jgi:hypothetical protein
LFRAAAFTTLPPLDLSLVIIFERIASHDGHRGQLVPTLRQFFGLDLFAVAGNVID